MSSSQPQERGPPLLSQLSDSDADDNEVEVDSPPEEKKEQEKKEQEKERMGKKRKTRASDPVEDSSTAFAASLERILHRDVPSDAQVPILAKRKGPERRLAKQAEQKREESVLQREKRQLKDKEHKTLEDGGNVVQDRQFRRLATRGVVKLFNAISKQQKSLGSQEKETQGAVKVDKMTKSSFLDMLRRPDKEQTETIAQDNAAKPKWGVLSDKFMLGAKMKEWGRKEDEEDQEESVEADGDLVDSSSEEE